MNGTNLFKIALRALNNNKLRAFLTMLGIIIGVASVITMLAIGQGSKKSIQAQISEMGSNMIMIHPGADMRGGVRQDPSAMQTLKLTDYETLRDETSFLAAVSPNVSSSGQLIAGNNNYPSSVNGVGTEYLEIRQLSIDNGEMFSEADIQSSAKVCVIGKTIVDNLFPDGEDPVGRIVRFSKIPFRVVGVLKSKVPARALRFTPEKPLIGDNDIVKDCEGEHKIWTREGNTFTAHPVQIGITNGINTEITQGASEGMVVVTEATIGNMPGGNVSPEGGQEGGGEQSPFMPSHPGSKKKGK